jgi:CBS domain-containing protein
MLVYNAMTRGVECIPPDATLRDAAKRMKALDVGSLPVCENDRLIGVVTDRDIAVRSVAEGNDPRFDRVRDTMTPRVVYCYDDEDVEAAAELMRAEQVRRLPVLNRDMRLVGILSLGDLAVETDDEQLAGHALEGISEPAEPRR